MDNRVNDYFKVLQKAVELSERRLDERMNAEIFYKEYKKVEEELEIHGKIIFLNSLINANFILGTMIEDTNDIEPIIHKIN